MYESESSVSSLSGCSCSDWTRVRTGSGTGTGTQYKRLFETVLVYGWYIYGFIWYGWDDNVFHDYSGKLSNPSTSRERYGIKVLSVQYKWKFRRFLFLGPFCYCSTFRSSPQSWSPDTRRWEWDSVHLCTPFSRTLLWHSRGYSSKATWRRGLSWGSYCLVCTRSRSQRSFLGTQKPSDSLR